METYPFLFFGIVSNKVKAKIKAWGVRLYWSTYIYSLYGRSLLSCLMHVWFPVALGTLHLITIDTATATTTTTTATILTLTVPMHIIIITNYHIIIVTYLLVSQWHYIIVHSTPNVRTRNLLFVCVDCSSWGRNSCSSHKFIKSSKVIVVVASVSVVSALVLIVEVVIDKVVDMLDISFVVNDELVECNCKIQKLSP